jgi:two-component system sensor histidine kinase/response regulator
MVNKEIINSNNDLINDIDNELPGIEELDSNAAAMQGLHELEIQLLIEKNKRLRAIIGHDIKTPVSSIVGYLAALKDKLPGIETRKIEEYVDIALLSAKRTFILLDNLLDWAHAENIIKSFRRDNINIYDLLLEEVENIQVFASDKLITIHTVNIPAETVFIDKNMIKPVFRNLLNNAIKYTYTNGEIIISSRKHEGFIEFSIKYDGIGINKESQHLIIMSDINNSIPGTYSEIGNGFGLLLCKDFIDIHGGKIWFISEPGKGSEFKFTLPLNPVTM